MISPGGFGSGWGLASALRIFLIHSAAARGRAGRPHRPGGGGGRWANAERERPGCAMPMASFTQAPCGLAVNDVAGVRGEPPVHVLVDAAHPRLRRRHSLAAASGKRKKGQRGAKTGGGRVALTWCAPWLSAAVAGFGLLLLRQGLGLLLLAETLWVSSC